MLNKFKYIIIIVTIIPNIYGLGNDFYPPKLLFFDAGIGYNLHLNEKYPSPVDYQRGGLYYALRTTYLFSRYTGISILFGHQDCYSYKSQYGKGDLKIVPLELGFNGTFSRLRAIAGVGIYLCLSEIYSDDGIYRKITDKSSYIDIGYFASISYGFDISFAKFSPEIKLNYLPDTRILSLTGGILIYLMF